MSHHHHAERTMKEIPQFVPQVSSQPKIPTHKEESMHILAMKINDILTIYYNGKLTLADQYN